MNALLKIKSRLGDGSVLNEYVSEIEMENGLAMWVRGTASIQNALKFNASEDGNKIRAAIATLFGDSLSDQGIIGVEIIFV